MNDSFIHTESTFEAVIVAHLCGHGWKEGTTADLNKTQALDERRSCGSFKPHSLDVIRHGITGSGCNVRLAYFKPDSSLDPDPLVCYKHNKFSVITHVYFSEKNNKSMDLVLLLNGLPLATMYERFTAKY